MTTATNPTTGERIYWSDEGQTWKPIPGTMRGVGRNILQGALADYGEEATASVAALPALFTDDNYQDVRGDILAQERQGIKDFEDYAPGTALTSEIAGSFLPVGLLSRTARPFLPFLQGKKALATIPATGALTGAIVGSGGAEEGGRIEGAQEGAMWGGLFSTVIPGMFAVGQTGINFAREFAYKMGWGAEAGELIKRAIEKSGATIDDVKNWYEKNIDADPTLADFNDGMRYGMRFATKGISEATTAAERYTTRGREAVNRIMKPLREKIGGGQEANLTRRELAEQRKDLAQPHYDEAEKLGLPFGTTQVLQDAAETLKISYPQIINEALREGATAVFGDTGKRIAPELLEEGADMSLRQWQMILQKLEDKTSKLYRDGEKGKGKSLNNVRKKIIKEIYRQNPAFETANNIWSSASRQQDLIDIGGDLLKEKRTSAITDMIDDLDQLTESEARLVSLGVAEAIQDKVVDQTGTTSAKLLLKETTQKKLRAILGDDVFTNLMDGVERELGYKRTENLARQGSDTATMLEMGNIFSPGGSIARRDVPLSQSGLTSRAVEETVQALAKRGLPPEVKNELGLMLTRAPDIPGLLNIRPQVPPQPYNWNIGRTDLKLPLTFASGLLGGQQ